MSQGLDPEPVRHGSGIVQIDKELHMREFKFSRYYQVRRDLIEEGK